MSAIKEHYHAQIEAAQRAKERPIIFTAEMVCAILEGRKTQTRRQIKGLPIDAEKIWHDGGCWIVENQHGQCWKKALKCPYGQPGYHLWVRETWRQLFGNEYAYSATDSDVYTETKWRPSIHMPRAAARIHLQITHIRAERLHDITDEDAIAEGIGRTRPNNGPNYYYDNYHTGRWMKPNMLNNPIASYCTLWEKIYGPGSWEQNPWVWAINFKKI